MRRMKGLTIVELMVVLLIAGIVGWFVVDFIIDKRCESDPSKALCVKRKGAERPN
jgi:prepilin-type N-terminal cleavage/methylation domain-containing protein